MIPKKLKFKFDGQVQQKIVDTIDQLIDYLQAKEEASKGEKTYIFNGEAPVAKYISTYKERIIPKDLDLDPDNTPTSKGECPCPRSGEFILKRCPKHGTGIKSECSKCHRTSSVVELDNECPFCNLPEHEESLEKLLKTLRDHSKYMLGDENQCVMCGMSWIKLADEIERLTVSKDKIKKEAGRLIDYPKGTMGDYYDQGIKDLLKSLVLGD